MAIKNILRNTGTAIRLGLLLTAMAGLGSVLVSCGGGGVAPTSTGTTPLSVLPAAPDLYELTPATITITGGKGPYTVFPANVSLLPTPSVSGNTFALQSNPVAADTSVKVTVQDSSSPQQTVDFTANLHASQLNNAIKVTPTQNGQTCGTAVCSGGSAVVTSTSAINGVVQRGRQVRFDVVQGAFSFNAATGNGLVSTVTAVTDASGVAEASIQVAVATPSQTAQLKVTDVPTGQFRYFNFDIQQITTTNTMLIVPATVTWVGAYNNACVIGGLSTHYIFGGTPPYTVSTTNPQAVTFTVTDPVGGNSSIEAKEGGAVLVSTTGFVCTVGTGGTTMIVRDATGGISQFTVNNNVGASAPPTVTTPTTVTLPAPTLNPASLGPLDCGTSASAYVDQVVPNGYTGTAPVLTATPLEPTRIQALLTIGTPNVLTVTRLANGPAGGSGSLVRVSNGSTFVDVTISLSTTTNNACASANGSGNPLSSATSSNIAVSITGSPNGTVSQAFAGGVGPYTVTSVGPTIATVGKDGVVFGSNTSLASNTTPFFVKGVSQGVTFVTVVDSSPTPQTLVFVVTVTP